MISDHLTATLDQLEQDQEAEQQINDIKKNIQNVENTIVALGESHANRMFKLHEACLELIKV